jgi:hypothetical protein
MDVNPALLRVRKEAHGKHGNVTFASNFVERTTTLGFTTFLLLFDDDTKGIRR